MEKLAPDHIDHRWVLDKGEVALLGSFGDDKMIADTARVSYRKGTKQSSTDAQLIRYLIRNKHTSPLEHCSVRFYLKAPLFVIQQLLRHRTFKFNQASARYSEMLNEAYVPLPEHVTTQDAKNKQARTEIQALDAHKLVTSIEEEQEDAFDHYNKYLGGGVARELARINLPHGTYSEIIVTTDLHNLLHFLALRLNPHAQYEIRVFAEAMAEFTKGLFPAAYAAWEDCSLNAFTLTGQMQDALNLLMANLITHADSPEEEEEIKLSALHRTLDMVGWHSQSERAAFATWARAKILKA